LDDLEGRWQPLRSTILSTAGFFVRAMHSELARIESSTCYTLTVLGRKKERKKYHIRPVLQLAIDFTGWAKK